MYATRLLRPRTNRRRAVRLLVARLRDGPCQVCRANAGDNQFHHLGAKFFNVGDATKHRPVALAREFAAGIALLCPECHRRLHAGAGGSGLVPLPVPDLDVWIAAGAFQRLFSLSATTAEPALGLEVGPGTVLLEPNTDATEAGLAPHLGGAAPP